MVDDGVLLTVDDEVGDPGRRAPGPDALQRREPAVVFRGLRRRLAHELAHRVIEPRPGGLPPVHEVVDAVHPHHRAHVGPHPLLQGKQRRHVRARGVAHEPQPPRVHPQPGRFPDEPAQRPSDVLVHPGPRGRDSRRQPVVHRHDGVAPGREPGPPLLVLARTAPGPRPAVQTQQRGMRPGPRGQVQVVAQVAFGAAPVRRVEPDLHVESFQVHILDPHRCAPPETGTPTDRTPSCRTGTYPARCGDGGAHP